MGRHHGRLRLSVVLFFGMTFVRFAHPLTDGDIWWHLNTGRWIVEHGALPTADPFTFTVSPEFADRARMSVQGNWLAQVLYYALFSAGGLQALRFFNAALFTTAAFAVYRLCRRGGLGEAWALLFTSPFVALAWHYDELRPFGFSVLFTAITLLQLDKAETEDATPGRSLAILIPVAVLWANLHRGFALFYLLLAPATLIWATGVRRRHAAWLTAAGLATLLNPGGFRPALSAIEESLQGTAGFNVLELAKPWEFAALVPAAGSYLPLAALLLAASVVALLLAGRHFPLALLVSWVLFAGAGLTAFRYTIYFGIVATFVAARGAARALAGTPTALERAGVAGALVASLALAATSGPWLAEPIWSAQLPRDAVTVMVNNKLPAPVLNPFDWGGYIAWNTGPHYRVFTDSRMLDYTLMKKMQSSRGERPLLEEYAINTVIWPSLDHASLRVPRLVLELLQDPQWTLVYYDRIAVLFVRSQVAPKTPRASAPALAQALLDVVRYRANRAGGWTDGDRDAAGALARVAAAGSSGSQDPGEH